MTREDIKEAAVNHYSRLVAFRAFMKGAEWRINSVWHDASKKPQDLKMLVAINKNDFPFVCGPHNTHWQETVKVFEVTKWAYIDDLLPNTED